MEETKRRMSLELAIRLGDMIEKLEDAQIQLRNFLNDECPAYLEDRVGTEKAHSAAREIRSILRNEIGKDTIEKARGL